MPDMKTIAAIADPQGLRAQWEAQWAARLAAADKYRIDASLYRETARGLRRRRSKVGQEAFAKYTRMADAAAAKASAYERGDGDTIARIEADNAAVDAVLGGGR